MSDMQVTQRRLEQSDRFDIFLGSIGFEDRSCFLAKKMRGNYSTAVGIAFTERKVLSYESNLNWCRSESFKIVDFDSSTDGAGGIVIALAEQKKHWAKPGPFSILVDISSMSRPMIGTVIQALSTFSKSTATEVTFAYCPSKYVELGDQLYTTSYIGPVVPRYAGWTTDPRSTVVAFVGLGGERGLALGAVEYLEVNDVWVFFPRGVDDAYDQAAKRANLELIERVGRDHILSYSPNSPYDCFCNLESLVFSYLRGERPILVPFGPKIFSVACMLVAELHYPKVAVWRVSANQDGPPIDRIANGEVFSLGVNLGFRGALVA